MASPPGLIRSSTRFKSHAYGHRNHSQAAIERAKSEGEPVYRDIAQRRFDLTSGSH